MIETPRRWDDAAPRPGFADELLGRLALGDAPSPASPGPARNLIAGALGGATIALLFARRRRER